MTSRRHRHRREAFGPSEQELDIAIARAARRWRHLDAHASQRLVGQAGEFARTRRWEGLEGLEPSPGIRGLISTTACLLTVNLSPHLLADVTSIIVAPTSEVRTARYRSQGLITERENVCVLGESMLHGPIRLSLDPMAVGADRDSGISVILHEFAHKIDMADGFPDGTPPVAGRRTSAEFESIAGTTLRDLMMEGARPPLRPYAAVNRSELFAVATETFFMLPKELLRAYPALYRLLSDFYRQDPRGPSDSRGLDSRMAG